MKQFSYSTIAPLANFSPWNGDNEFLSTFNQIKNDSYLDIYRCFELWKLVEEMYKLSPNASILEVGVWRGGSAGILAKKCLLLGGKPKLFLADTFSGVVKASERDNVYIGGEHQDTSSEIAEVMIRNVIGYDNFEILKGVFPDETACLIPDETLFGLCHLDVDVYLSTKDVVDWIFDKLVIGGMIVFDDYGFELCQGVTQFVEEQRLLKDRLIIHNLNGHAILIKIK